MVSIKLDKLLDFGINLVTSLMSHTVTVSNGSSEQVRVIVKDERPEAGETDVYVGPGRGVQHRSTGLTNDPHFAVRVRVLFGEGVHAWEQSVNTLNNRSVIVTAERMLVHGKYETWYEGNDSSIWRDVGGNCHNPRCPKDRKGSCQC